MAKPLAEIDKIKNILDTNARKLASPLDILPPLPDLPVLPGLQVPDLPDPTLLFPGLPPLPGCPVPTPAPAGMMRGNIDREIYNPDIAGQRSEFEGQLIANTPPGLPYAEHSL